MTQELEKKLAELQRENLQLKKERETLAEEADNLQLMLDRIPDIIGVIHPDLTVERYNQAGYDFLNMSQEQVRGRKCYDLIGRKKPCEICACSKALYKKSLSRCEKYFPELDIYMHCLATPVVNQEGEVTHIIEQLRDITGQKNTENALRESEERYRSLFDEAPVGICSVTVQGEYISVNSALARMYGYSSPTEMKNSISNSSRVFVYPEDRAMMLDWLERFDRVFNFECKVRGKEGKEFWTSRRVRAIRDDQGRFTHYQSFVEDIQARKEAELLSERSRKQLISILEQLHAGVFVLNPDNNRIIFANKYLHRAMGKDVLGEDPYRVLIKEGRDCHFCLDKVELDKIDTTLSREVLFKDNRWYLCTANLASWFDGSLVVLVIAMDITKNKEAEQLKEDMERITRHDLKSPLNGIVGLPDLLISSGKFDDKEIEMLRAIRDSGKKMQNLIDSSLSLYELENGEYEVECEHMDLFQVFRQIETEVKTKLQSKDISLQYYLGSRPLNSKDAINLHGDRILIPFLFSNLIKNAVEASPPRNTVCISIIPQEPLRITIHNHGSVPEEIRNTFFDKYVSCGKNNGTGLGTYSALLAAHAHQGDIGMQSSEEAGTSITVILPQENIKGNRG
ncbi:MAG: PAS domain S-box protein [Thermodesulfobacteriota bacterium]